MAARIVRLEDSSGAMPRAPLPGPLRTDPSVPSLTGGLAPGIGARVLMDLFVDERSGRLLVDGMPGPRGTLFFLGGEPVYAATAGSSESLVKRLGEKGQLRPPPTNDPLAKMNPLAKLSRCSHPVAVLEALRDEVREFCSQLLVPQFGEWAFFDDEGFVEYTPLTAVNPFGFVLDARRRALTPDAMLRLGEELAKKVPEPRSGFANVASRLRAFTGQVDLAGVVDGTRTCAEIYKLTGLHPLVGGLVLQTLVETGLVTLLNAPRSTSKRDRRKAATSAMPALVQADSQILSQLASLPGRGGAEILSLYLDIKPERSDFAILGVDPQGWSPAAVERGYQQRLAELDPRAIPSGGNRPYLLARVEELRTKVERAYRTLTATQTRAAPAAYEILDKIGEGGMAEVYRGHASDDPSRVVAVKRILPKLREDPDFGRQFLEEARLARRVEHPNVVKIYTVGKSGEDLYLAMEFVDGLDLGELTRRAKRKKEPVPIDIACRVVADACGGLHAAHTAHDRLGNVTPILHRDVSPQNILVSRAGDVKLTDFGIAKAGDTQEGEDNGQVKGKVPYLSPELIDGEPASVRSDVYAMAMTLYATLAHTPFSRGEMFQTMRAILMDPLVPASSLRPDVPEVLDALLLRAGAKKPEERHASAQELQLELEEFLATRPPVDVGAWACALGVTVDKPDAESAPRAPTHTIPIIDLGDG